MKLKIVSTLALLAALDGSVPAAGADNRYPDWPCRQLKVPELSIAAIWPGAAEGIENPAAQVPGLDGIAALLAQRRTPMEEAEKQISAVIAGTEAEKKEKANALFMKLFDALNAQRFQVMNGLERAYRRQKDFAEKIRADMAKLRGLSEEKAGEAPSREELLQQVQWETRIFDERRKTLSYACEVPVQIDQRLFALARVIQKAAGMSGAEGPASLPPRAYARTPPH